MMLFGGTDIGEIEIRAQADGAHLLRGRFPYGRPAVLSDGGRNGRPRKEIIAPRAFAYRIEDPNEDIFLLAGHDYNRPLASKKNGTLQLHDADDALTFNALLTPEIGSTTFGLDILKAVSGGLVAGVSPGFRLPPTRAVRDAETITQEPVDPSRGMYGAIIRTVTQALLYELSVVTVPAYPEAQIEMRNWRPDRNEAPDAGLRRYLQWR
jgi:HK97 family phage prohead protease